jgi:phosphocarrier protein
VIEREVTIANELGLHARAAARLVHVASRFSARITLSKDSRTVDAKSILGILLLAAAKGDRLTIRADGPDETDAVDALTALVLSRFGETQ